MRFLRPFIITLILSCGITFVAFSQAWKSGSSKLYANPTSTKVGIGTTSPISPLHVQRSLYGPVDPQYRAVIYGYNTSTETSYKNPVGILGKVNGASGMGVYGENLSSSGFGGYFVGKGYFSGKVGIGTTNPKELLHLNGSIRGNQSGALRINSGNGYIDIGAKNTSYAHITTDRHRFYFNKEIRVNSGLIGSYDENLSLRVSGSTKMTLTSGGNVGIGTTSPSSKLEVAGMIHSTSGGIKLPDGTIIDDASDLGSGGGGEVNTTNVALGKPVSGNASYLSRATDGNMTTYAYTSNDVDFEIVVDLESDYYIEKMDGPDIELTSKGSTFLYVSFDGTEENFERILSTGLSGDTKYYEVCKWVKKIKVEIKNSQSPDPFRVYELKAFGTTQPANGYFSRVGIGTTDLTGLLNVNGNATIKELTTKKLEVNGPIWGENTIYALGFYSRVDNHYFLCPASTTTSLKVKGNIITGGKIEAEELEIKEIASNTIITDELKTNSLNVKVENVADYIFNKDYSLRSLKEVENFVTEHKHLPEIPSAEDLEREGMDVAKMNNLLLQKIEELTLYIIQITNDQELLLNKIERLESKTDSDEK